MHGKQIGQIPIKLKNCQIIFDFTESDPQQKGNVNAPISITTAATYYVIRLVTGRHVPTNEGCFRSVRIIAPKGSVVNPNENAATSSANTETSSRIVDVVMGAMGKIIDFPGISSIGSPKLISTPLFLAKDSWG